MVAETAPMIAIPHILFNKGKHCEGLDYNRMALNNCF